MQTHTLNVGAHPPEVQESTNSRQQRITAAAFGLQTVVGEALEAFESDEDAILALEREGLADAIRFVRPMQVIRRLPTDSPVRKLTVFQMACLYSEREAIMISTTQWLDDELRSGHRQASSVRMGIVKIAQAALKARADAEKLRRGNTGARISKSDLYNELGQTRDELEKLRAFCQDLAHQADVSSVDQLIADFYAGGSDA